MNTSKLLITAFSVAAMMSAQSPAAERALKICVADNAPAEIKTAAGKILAGVKTHPLLSVLAEGKAPASLTDTKALADGSIDGRAYSHLVVVGLPTDPIIAQAWQRNARAEENGFYIFGFGHLRGTLGYIESDRNPFLHSAAVASTPFETEIVTITGETPAGVALAVDAFLKQGLVNGVIAASGWKRSGATLLDRDPLSPDFKPELPVKTDKSIGLTQAGEDEYSGVLADTDLMPVAIWHAKFFVPGAWDGAGAANSVAQYLAGLHRRAYGNMVWCAKFDSSENAALAAPKIAAAAGLTQKDGIWAGGGNNPKDTTSLPMELWQEQSWVIMSSLPEALNKEIKLANVEKAVAGGNPNADGKAAAGASGEFIWGVTVDDVSETAAVVDALASLRKRPFVRIVFDEGMEASEYKEPVKRIHKVAGVMGEILDSQEVKNYSLEKYKARTTEYIDALGDSVDIWEVGNEINGEWLKEGAMDKVAAAYDIVKARGRKTAITLYYNPDCWSDPRNEMFRWAAANVPARMKEGLDYVLISYYEHDCNDCKPDWQKVFDRLHGMFPKSKIGFGETGSDKGDQAEYLPRYYRLHITTKPLTPQTAPAESNFLSAATCMSVHTLISSNITDYGALTGLLDQIGVPWHAESGVHLKATGRPAVHAVVAIIGGERVLIFQSRKGVKRC